MPLRLTCIGNHIRFARYLRRLTLDEAGVLIGTKSRNLVLWEQGNTEPPIRAIPGILRFLGYDPYSPPWSTLRERLFAFRRALGLDRRQAASLYGVGERTWGDWELGYHLPFPQQTPHLEDFLETHHAKAIQGWPGGQPSRKNGVPACFRIVQSQVVRTDAVLAASRIRWTMTLQKTTAENQSALEGS